MSANPIANIRLTSVRSDYFTVTLTVLVTPLHVTVILAVPFLIPLIVPLDDTVAIFLLPDLYVTFPDGAAFAVILVVLPTFYRCRCFVQCKSWIFNCYFAGYLYISAFSCDDCTTFCFCSNFTGCFVYSCNFWVTGSKCNFWCICSCYSCLQCSCFSFVNSGCFLVESYCYLRICFNKSLYCCVQMSCSFINLCLSWLFFC